MGAVRATALVPDFDGGSVASDSGGSAGFVTLRLIPQPRVVRSRAQNEPVLAALRKVTGEDFGYDRGAWQRWWWKQGKRLAREQETNQLFTAPAPGGKDRPERPGLTTETADRPEQE